MEIYILLLCGHFIADFVCQTDRMALNKSYSFSWLILHIVTYIGWLFIALLGIRIVSDISLTTLAMYCIANGTVHLLVDFVTSKLSRTLYQKGDRHSFFVVIGADQLIHTSVLLYSWKLFFPT